MKQQLINGSIVIIPNNSLRFNCLIGTASGVGTWVTAESNAQQIIPTAGVLRKLKVSMRPGYVLNAQPMTFTLRKNGADTALTATVAVGSSSAQNFNTDISVSPGDLVCISAFQAFDAGATTFFWKWSFEFEGTDSTKCIHMASGNQSLPVGVSTQYYCAFGNSSTWLSTLDVYRSNVNILKGTITDFWAAFTTAPGTGKSRIFSLWKNNSEHVASRVTISDSATSGSVSGLSLGIDALDLLTTGMKTSAAAPAASQGGKWSVAITSNTPGEYQNFYTLNEQAFEGDDPFYTGHMTGANTVFSLGGDYPSYQQGASSAFLVKDFILQALGGGAFSPTRYIFTLVKNGFFTSLVGDLYNDAVTVRWNGPSLRVESSDFLAWNTETAESAPDQYFNFAMLLGEAPPNKSKYIDGGYYY